jgi:hypothetical protein
MPMPASVAEIAELRREGQALSLDDVDRTLQSLAEIIGFFIHQLRSIGADQAEVPHHVELLVVATSVDRTDIREARDVLLRLGYGRDIGLLLTKLARRAKPKPVYWTPPGRGRTAC